MADYSDKEDKRKQESKAFAEAKSDSNEAAKGLIPPTPFGPTQAPVQKKEAAPIQREEKEEDKKKDKGVDVDIKVLPPSVQMAFWRFKMSAGVTGAKLGYKQDDFGADLEYSYGSSLSLGATKGPFSLSGSLNPETKDYGMKAGYKKGQFNAGLGYDSKKQQGSLSLGWGAPILPFPDDKLSETMQNGTEAANNMMMQGPLAPLDDPMGYMGKNKKNIDHLTEAGKIAAKLAKAKKGVKLGVGVRLSADQLGAFKGFLTVQGAF